MAFVSNTVLFARAHGRRPAIAHGSKPDLVMVAQPVSRVWTPSSWRNVANSDLNVVDRGVADAEKRLSSALPLVFSGEVDSLLADLANVAQGRGFVLQGGDCVDGFDEFERLGGADVRDSFVLLVQMSIMMMYGMRLPVVKMLRGAGQFAEKDLNSETGALNGPSMVHAYEMATATINLLRMAASGGQLDLHRIHDINLKFVRGTAQGAKFAEQADHIAAALSFMESVGVATDTTTIRQADFCTSHECRLLPYEESLLRRDSKTGLSYATSAHFLWVGEERRNPDGPEVEFLRGIANPVGVKIGPRCTPKELVDVIKVLDPSNTPGKVTVITRLGAGTAAETLPDLISTVQGAGLNVVWSCDPCSGNTVKTAKGVRTRRFDSVLQELREFFAAHESAGTHPGAIHLELTGQDVAECVGGMMDVKDDEASTQREGVEIDPRLNASQALELAFLVSENLNGRCFL